MKKITLLFFVVVTLSFTWQSNAQFTESFDTEIPVSWTIVDVDGGNTWIHDATSPHAGAGNARITYNSNAHEDYLITPQFTVTSGASDRISFWAGISGTFFTETFDVKLSTAGTAANNFTVTLASETATTDATVGDYTQYSYDISAYDGQAVYIAIVATDTDRFYLYVDEFVNDTPPSCQEPSGMTASNVTATSADLSWTASASGEVAWNLEWKAGADFAPGTGAEDDSAAPTTTPTYTAMGLTPATTYFIYYQADCTGGDTSAWVGPFTGTTLCTTFTAPYTQDFENAGSIPNCWTNSGAENWNFSDSGAGNHIGANGTITGSTASNGYFAWVDSSGTEADAILESAMVDVSGLTTPALLFYELSDNEGFANSQLDVEVWDGAAWNNVGTFNTNTVGWEQKIIDLSGLTITGDVQARFTMTEPISGDYYDDIAIDDVSFEELPACPVPGSFVVTPTSLTDVTFTWAAGSSETDWNYEYGPTGFTQGTGTAGSVSTTPTLGLTGLTAGDTYDIYLQADCGGATSSFISITWTQPSAGETCAAPIVIGALPYNTSDDTANYGDDYSGTPGATGCGTTSSYLNGDDVVYSYTATSDTSINIGLSAIGSTYSGIFVYADCADIGTACIAGEGNSGTVDRNFDLAVTNGNTYYIVISTYASPQSTTYTLDITENTCTAATVTYTIVDDCATSGGFLIDVEVTDMGSATAITVSNDQDATTHAVTATGTVQFGPYTNATDIVITVVDDNDTNCTQSSSAITQAACPPANDDCSGAIALTPTVVFEDGPLAGLSNAGATDSEVADPTIPVPGCASYSGGDMWYSIVVPADGNITLEMDADPNGGGGDAGGAAYSGTCGALVLIDCDDDGGPGLYPQISISDPGLAGQTIYFRVWEYGNNSTIDYRVAAWSATLSTDNFEFSGFKYFPNPVEGTLALRAQDNMQNVAVYNMLGQEVINISPNTMSNDLDMSTLSRGTYFVRISINGAVENFKIIKE